MPPRTDADSPVMEALRTRRSVLRERLPAAVKLEMAGDFERLRIFDRLSPTSLVCAPLSARGRTLGVISFLTVRSGRRFERLDLGLVEELARRAALAMDNAELYRRAEEASRAKDEFLATVSHELRTPLASILGWTRLLRRGGLSLREAGPGARDAGAQCAGADPAGRGPPRRQPHRLRQDAAGHRERRTSTRIVEAAVDSIRPGAEARGVRLEVSGQPCPLAGDPERLHQILWNLLSNAVKFTPRGGRVSVSLAVGDRAATLTVSDTGQGIRPDFLPHVFERFRQADATATRAHGGLGLGLAIVRHLVELHGGTVAASSSGEGQGATFTVQLPLSLPVPVDRPLHEAAATPSNRVDLPGCACWWWTTSRTPARCSPPRSRHTGPRWCQLADAEETLHWLGSNRADILVSDVAMPRHGRLRADPGDPPHPRPARPATMPAVAVSAFARPEDRRRALDAGFQDYLTKPVEPEVLVARVAALARPRAAA